MHVSNPKQIASRSIVGMLSEEMSTFAVILRPVAVSVTNIRYRPAQPTPPLHVAPRLAVDANDPYSDLSVRLERCRRIRVSGRDLETVDDHASGTDRCRRQDGTANREGTALTVDRHGDGPEISAAEIRFEVHAADVAPPVVGSRSSPGTSRRAPERVCRRRRR